MQCRILREEFLSIYAQFPFAFLLVLLNMNYCNELNSPTDEMIFFVFKITVETNARTD